MDITQIEKEKITLAAANYVERYASQNQAAATLSGISPATLSKVLNHDWDLISSNKWRTLMAGLSYNPNEEPIVEISTFKTLTKLFVDVQQNALSIGVIGEAGIGKSHAIKYYEATNRDVISVQCREYWNRKLFLAELLTKMGRVHNGMTVAEMMTEVVRRILMMDKPIIILDEFDKPSDKVMSFFITMYNELEDRCGFVVIATNHLKKRVIRGVQLNKKGYNEIYSRLGRRFIELKGVGSQDIIMICMARGITERAEIKKIIEDSDYDLRRVNRKIHAIKAKKKSHHKKKKDNTGEEE